jgi:hypothetical protein
MALHGDSSLMEFPTKQFHRCLLKGQNTHTHYSQYLDSPVMVDKHGKVQHHHLVGGWPSPLKNMKVSWDDYSQYMEK